MKKTTIRQKVRKKDKRQMEERELVQSHLASLAPPSPLYKLAGIKAVPRKEHERLFGDTMHQMYMRRHRRRRHLLPFEDPYDYPSDEDEDQPPLTDALAILLAQVPREQHYYVYDVYNYAVKLSNFSKELTLWTENTLRIGVISPVIFGLKRQNDSILDWAEDRSLLPSDWECKDVYHNDLTQSMITFVEIADTFVQCLLRTESLNLIKISYHIGEWYNFSDKFACHEMRPNYSLTGLKADLYDMMLLQSVTLIYADNPAELVWHIAVFVCHQYFFYLADSEYRNHPFLEQIKHENNSPESKRLRELGNECHKDMKYSEAIKIYGDALAESPYNHTLYSNRAMAYLKLRDTPEYTSNPAKASKCAYSAMCDAFRCTKLDPLYSKGHDRYAMALVALNKTEAAVKALKAAILLLHKHGLHDGVRSLEKRLLQYAPNEQSPVDRPAGGDDVGGGKSKTKATKGNKDSSSKDASDTKPSSLDHLFANGSFRKNLKDKLSKPSVTLSYTSVQTVSKTTVSKTKSDNQVKLSKSEQIVSNNSNGVKDSNDNQAKNSDTTSSVKQNGGKAANKAKKSSSAMVLGQEPSTGQPVDSVTEKAKEELLTSLKKGSEAFLSEKYRFAISLYDRCFWLIHEYTASVLDQSAENVLVLRYARAVAYTSVGPSEDLVTGVKELKSIMEHQPTPTMKAITLYELGIACSKQHSYAEALENIEESLKICRNKKGLRHTYYWPGTLTFIQHTDVSVLKEKLSSLRRICEHPPPPDYICTAELRLCKSYGHISSHIYIDDPNFKGFVCVCCSEKCLLYYHRECYKKKHIKIQNSCITPDCEGFICRLVEYDEQNEKLQEEKSDRSLLKPVAKEKKQVLKLPLSNAAKIERKKQKKQLRKEARSGAGAQAEPVEQEKSEENLADKLLASSGETTEKVPEYPQPDVRMSNFVIKHKKKEDEMEQLQQQANRKQTKKVKSKQTMSLEEFCGPPEDTGSYSSGSYGLEMSQMMPEQHRVAQFEQEYQPNTLPVVIQGVSVDKLMRSVEEFYFDMLNSGGPMRVDSESMTGFLEFEDAARELVEYCGGLASLLLSTGRFAMLENLVFVKSDLRKAQEMVNSVRSVAHGVAVVPHDFKENLERANAYVPERKRFSAYDNSVDMNSTKPVDSQQWKSVVDQWNRTADDSVSEGRDRSASASISISDSLSEVDFDIEKKAMSPVPTRVEKISPELMKAWKQTLGQGILESANNLCADNTAIDPVSSKSADGSSSPVSSNVLEDGDQPVEWSTNSGRNSSIDFLDTEQSPVHDNDRIMTLPALADIGFSNYTQSEPVLPSPVSQHSHMFIPNTSVYSQPNIPPYISSTDMQSPFLNPATHLQITGPLPPTMLPVQPPMARSQPQAPIGTPFSNTPYSIPHFSSANTWALESRNSTQQSSWLKTACMDTQTDECIMVDKECNTEYESMDDHNKLHEECSMLRARNEDLSDKLIQLKQATSVEIQDLTRQLNDALQNERSMRDRSDKVLGNYDKETRKWKDEKRALTDEVNSLRQTCNESRWKCEEKDSKIKDIEEKLKNSQRTCEDLAEERDSIMRQYQARLDTIENRVLKAEVEVIDERERFALARCNEAIENTNKSIDQQRAQLERISQTNQAVPPIVHKTAQLANTRRQKLLDIRDEQLAIYESQREAIRSGTIPLSTLPKLSPPSLLEVLASTAAPVPRPPMPPMMGPRYMHPQMQMRPPYPLRMVRPEAPVSPVSPQEPVTARSPNSPTHGPPNHLPQPVTEDTRPATPVKDQSRRNAAELQLIQHVQDVFPNLSGDDVKSYINKLRQTRVSLTGLKLIDLERQIIELILADIGSQSNHAQGGRDVTRNTSIDECTICHEGMTRGTVRRLACNHSFHQHCIQDWFSRQNTCPVCRSVQR